MCVYVSTINYAEIKFLCKKKVYLTENLREFLFATKENIHASKH